MSKICKICNNEMYLRKMRDSIGGVTNLFWCEECGTIWIRTQNPSTRQWIEYWEIPKRQEVKTELEKL